MYIIRYTSKVCGLVLQFGQRAETAEAALKMGNPWGLNEENYYISVVQA